MNEYSNSYQTEKVLNFYTYEGPQERIYYFYSYDPTNEITSLPSAFVELSVPLTVLSSEQVSMLSHLSEGLLDSLVTAVSLSLFKKASLFCLISSTSGCIASDASLVSPGVSLNDCPELFMLVEGLSDSTDTLDGSLCEIWPWSTSDPVSDPVAQAVSILLTDSSINPTERKWYVEVPQKGSLAIICSHLFICTVKTYYGSVFDTVKLYSQCS